MPSVKATLAVIGVGVVALFVKSVAGQNVSPEQRGLEIAQEVDRRDKGFGDQSSDVSMTLRNSHGESSERALRIRVLEVPADGDKSLIVFNSPKDISGTALTTHSHWSSYDDQWLFMPAVKRVKRIAASSRSGSFVGSEFAYEDLSSQEAPKYRHTYRRDEKLSGQDCFVVERVPKDEKSGYQKQLVWFDKQEYRPMQIQFFDRGGALLKTLTFSGYTKYANKFWRPASMEMLNHQTGKSTRLSQSGIKFKTGLRDADFDPAALESSR